MENFRPAFVCFYFSTHILSDHAPVRRPRQVLQDTLSLWKNEDVVPFYQILNVKL